MTPLKKKICLIGAFAVGKTSLVERFVHNRFDEKYLTTIGVKVSQKILAPLKDPQTGQTIQHTLIIWDIAGLGKFDRVARNYFRGASAALAVADLTRPETIGRLKEYCENFRTVCPQAPVVVLGNKFDLFDDNAKTLSQLKGLAEHYSIESLLTSAKTGQMVEQAFQKLSIEIES
jgi:small GTP-binding protein